jgi:aquaporin Z
MLLGTDATGGHLAVAFAFGLSIVAMAYVIGGISGCHINPAVSFGVFLNKGMSGKDFIGYVVFQVIGGIIGGALLVMLTKFGIEDLTGGFGSNGVANVGVSGALIIEIILTFIFVFLILGVTNDESKGAVAGLTIGLTLTFVHIVGIPLTGTSVNPARSIGPAIFAGGDALANVWVFIVAPLIGAAIAVLVYKLVNVRKEAA